MSSFVNKHRINRIRIMYGIEKGLLFYSKVKINISLETKMKSIKLDKRKSKSKDFLYVLL